MTHQKDSFPKKKKKKKNVMKIDKLSLQVLLLHYSELPYWKESEIQCERILGAIDLLKHLAEKAEALERDRM